jgi:hypothetical protein
MHVIKGRSSIIMGNQGCSKGNNNFLYLAQDSILNNLYIFPHVSMVKKI